MKNGTNKHILASKPTQGKRGTQGISRGMADKQPEQPLVEQVPKTEELRQRSVDVNHRFGKSSGS